MDKVVSHLPNSRAQYFSHFPPHFYYFPEFTSHSNSQNISDTSSSTPETIFPSILKAPRNCFSTIKNTIFPNIYELVELLSALSVHFRRASRARVSKQFAALKRFHPAASTSPSSLHRIRQHIPLYPRYLFSRFPRQCLAIKEFLTYRYVKLHEDRSHLPVRGECNATGGASGDERGRAEWERGISKWDGKEGKTWNKWLFGWRAFQSRIFAP